MNDQSWRRYDLSKTISLAPLFRNHGSGIYILEFANGEYYVGQTRNALQRFTAHIRHWGDVTAIRFLDVPEKDLDLTERMIIYQWLEDGWSLRNVRHNPGHSQFSRFDNLMPVIEQHHWALGNSPDIPGTFAAASGRSAPQSTKLTSSRFASVLVSSSYSAADAALHDLAAVIKLAIPAAVDTEALYWTITDYPSTAGGRLATLNVGDMEVLYFPRPPFKFGTPFHLLSVLNVAPKYDIVSSVKGVILNRNIVNYRAVTPVDQLIIPLGEVETVLEDFSALAALRDLVLMLMRSSTSAKFRRWHSFEMARRAYGLIADI